MNLTKNDKRWLRAVLDRGGEYELISGETPRATDSEDKVVKLTTSRFRKLVDARYLQLMPNFKYRVTRKGEAQSIPVERPEPEPDEFVAPKVTLPLEVSMYEPKDKVFLTRVQGGDGHYGDVKFEFHTDWSGGSFIVDVKRRGKTIRSYTLSVGTLAIAAIEHCNENAPEEVKAG